MLTVTRDQVKLAYRLTGLRDQAAPTALLIHGLGTNLAFWHPALLTPLGAQRRLLALDLRGHGYSDLPTQGYTSLELAADALAILDAQQIASADLVAHSYGASVALQLARLHPQRIRSVTVLDGRIRALQGSLKLADWPQFDRWRRHLETAGVPLEDGLDLDFKVPLYLAGETWQQLREGLEADGFFAVAKSPRTMARYRKLLSETRAPEELIDLAGLTAEALSEISAPVLALYGQRSPFFPTGHALSERLPRARLETLPDVGHNFAFLKPVETAERILHFWTSPGDSPAQG